MSSNFLVTKRSLLQISNPSYLLLLSSLTTSNNLCNINAFSTYTISNNNKLSSSHGYVSKPLNHGMNMNHEIQLLNCMNNNKHNSIRNFGFTSLRSNNIDDIDSSGDYEKTLSEFLQQPIRFRKGDLIQVEVVKFGRLGASVEIIAHNSHYEKDLIPEEEEPLGYGLILQREIGYFRASRGGLDVVKGEILPAYVEWVRDDGKVDIALRKPGGKGKAEDLGEIILDKLKQSGGDIPVGDKSSPETINELFPGSSKASFKRAVAALYKKGLVQPAPFSTKLLK